MFCYNCGKEQPDENTICDNCGANLAPTSSPVTTNEPPQVATEGEKAEISQTTPESDQQNNQATNNGKSWKQITALVLGIVSIFFFFVPFIGPVVALVGLIIGIMGLRTSRKTMPIIGLVLSSISLLLSLLITFTLTLGFIEGFSNAETYSRERANDASKKATIHEIQNALEQYYVDNNVYPPALANLKATTPPLLGTSVTTSNYRYIPANRDKTYTLSFTLENQDDTGDNVSGTAPDRSYQVTNKQ